MIPIEQGRSALVFGASGFIGRWLVKELLERDVATTAAVRSTDSAERVSTWLREHDVPTQALHIRLVDLTVDGAGVGQDILAEEVYNVAGAYVFGMSNEEARAANVDTARKVVELCATMPGLRRLVHLSGYRVGGQDPDRVPWSEAHRAAEYRRLGAYEGSKVESDAVVQSVGRRLGVSLTIANPSTVIGDSVTGESDQLIGLAATVLDLLKTRLPLLPGGSRTFVPIVTVDYLARFLTLLPTREETVGQSYWVLDDATPALPTLLRLIAEHHGVHAPRLTMPIGLLKRLPARLTKAETETLGFLSADRYPTAQAESFAQEHGLHHPNVTTSLRRWSDYLTNTTGEAVSDAQLNLEKA